jgi:uncharacterized protein (TIGR02588 family)
MKQDNEERPQPKRGQEEKNEKDEGQGKKQGSNGGRKLAEWVSLGISILLIVGTAGYLIYQMFLPRSPYLRLTVKPLIAEVRQQGKQYILPVEVSNNGRRTIRELTVEVKQETPEGQQSTREIKIDYLGEKSRQKAYLTLEQDPRSMKIEAAPSYYLLD